MFKMQWGRKLEEKGKKPEPTEKQEPVTPGAQAPVVPGR